MIPPVKTVNGKVVPISDSVIAEPNVFVMFAPIGAKEHARPITAPENNCFYKCFELWHVVCQRFCVWQYYASFRRSFEFADGLYIFKENIEALKKLGCEYYFVEINGSKGSIEFQKMHVYVLTSLEWNVNQSTDDLVNDFMANYYKCAAPAMRKFYDYLNAYYDKTRKRIKKLTGRPYYHGICAADVVPIGFWELNAVYDMTLIFEEADKAIKDSDLSSEQKQIVQDRIDLERLMLLYIQLEYFVSEVCAYDEARTTNTYPRERALEMLKEFEEGVKKFDITRVDGDGTVEETIKKWRREINWTARGWDNNIINAQKNTERIMNNLLNK
jgi:hypothetical protein